MVKKRAGKRKKVQLSDREERFCQEWVKSHHKTQAAILAGYNPKNAGTYCQRLYKKAIIQARIKELEEAVSKTIELDSANILLTFKKIAEFSIDKIADFDGTEFLIKPMSEWPEGASVAIASFKQTIKESSNEKHGSNNREVTIDVKFESKQAACVSLGNHLGLFTGYETLVKSAETFGLKLVPVEDK
jgi:phage terminase small subunit